MKKNIIVFMLVGVLASCKNDKQETETIIKDIPVTMKVVRFEQAFFDTKPNELSKVKAQYPEFFPANTPNEVWLEKLQNKDWRDMYSEVEIKYKDFSKQQTQIEDLFKHIKHYFPTVQTPQIYTIIGDMDYTNKTIYAKNKLIIGLEMYLGANHKFYTGVPEYIRQNFEEKQMLPDVAQSFADGIIAYPKDKQLIAQMIYFGKQLYLKDLLLPNYDDAQKIGYTPQQLAWAQENESYIWSYFIEKQLLYSNDPKVPGRFIDLAPFSKFYLEIDNDSPGRIGQYIGWQIVKSYAENNPKMLPQDLIKLDAKTLFEQSKYKPQKKE